MQLVDKYELVIIGYIYNDFPTKFGLPRQSGLVDSLLSKIVLTPEFNNSNSIRGLDGFSYLWLLWGFSKARQSRPSQTVRPPRLGGNTRVGVFASRSPFRPNPIGLSSVKLEKITKDSNDNVEIYVSGADIMSGSPIFDIKPYLPYCDVHSDARGGFTEIVNKKKLKVHFPQDLLGLIPTEKQDTLVSSLSQDPRPAYQNDEDKIYGFFYSDYNIKFSVSDSTLFVTEVDKLER